MFASPLAMNPLLRFAQYPGVIDESGAARAAAGGSPALGPPGNGMNASGPSTINLTAPDRYGRAPSIFGGQPMARPLPPPSGIAAAASPDPRAAGGGMFAAKPKGKMDWGAVGLAVAQALLAGEAARGDRGAAILLDGLQNQMLYRQKKRDSDAQTAGYVQALVAKGMDPNEAAIIAADPQEMAKHFGTRFDAATIDEGSSRYVPNLNGTTNVFTSPKTFTHGADVVQMPGSQTVAPDFGSLSSPLGVPQAIGAPTQIPGLRTDAEQYAGSLGLTPGSPAYTSALQDYALKAYGPTAQGMQADRLSSQQTIAAGHDATSRYRVDHPAPPRAHTPAPVPTPSTVVGSIMDKQARGEPLTASEQRTLTDYRASQHPGRRGFQNGSMPRPGSKAEMDRLPSGTSFIAPDGSVRVKP